MTNPNIVPSSLVPASPPAPSPQCRVTKPARCISCPPLPRGPCWRPPVHLGGRDEHGFSGDPRGRPGARTPRGSDCSFEHLPSISHFWAASTFLPILQPSGSLNLATLWIPEGASRSFARSAFRRQWKPRVLVAHLFLLKELQRFSSPGRTLDECEATLCSSRIYERLPFIHLDC